MVVLYKPKTWRSERYLAFVREFPCLMCHLPSNCLKKPENNIIAHHESFGGMNFMSGKPPDMCAVPLCARCHNIVHGFKWKESDWTYKYNVDPLMEIIKLNHLYLVRFNLK